MTGTTAPAPEPSLTAHWQPRYWPVWCGLLGLRALSALPVGWQLACGRLLGHLLGLVLRGRRRIAATNIRLCFPELSPEGQADLLRAHFASLGMTLVEHGLAWWASDATVRQLVDIRGAEHLEAAVASGRGIVLLTGHFGPQEFSGRRVSPFCPKLTGVYRPSRNALVDAILRRIRGRVAGPLIPKKNVRQLIRALRNGYAVWYAPDQSYRGSFSALLPFMGEPAMTNTALTEIARLGNAVVIPLLPRRLAGGAGYIVEILPPMADIPGPDPAADALRVNALLESHIRRCPEQYYWIHRRFKGRPAPYPDPYA